MIDHHKYKNVSAIYKWENLKNGKCYIGQAKDLYIRIKHHLGRMKNASKNDDCLLYRAVAKYGIDQFDLEILEILPNSNTKCLLNEREKFYISLYDSYRNGYNLTLGGDGGCLGYKFTSKQIENCKKAAKENSKKLRKAIFLYNIKTNEFLHFDSIINGSREININYGSLERCCMHKIWLCDKKYLGAFSEDSLNKRILEFKEYLPERSICKKSNNGRGKSKRSRMPHTQDTKNKIASNVSKYEFIVIDTFDDVEYKFNNTKEVAKFFGVTPNTFLGKCKKGMGRDRLYRDKYYIKLINKK